MLWKQLKSQKDFTTINQGFYLTFLFSLTFLERKVSKRTFNSGPHLFGNPGHKCPNGSKIQYLTRGFYYSLVFYWDGVFRYCGGESYFKSAWFFHRLRTAIRTFIPKQKYPHHGRTKFQANLFLYFLRRKYQSRRSKGRSGAVRKNVISIRRILTPSFFCFYISPVVKILTSIKFYTISA